MRDGLSFACVSGQSGHVFRDSSYILKGWKEKVTKRQKNDKAARFFGGIAKTSVDIGGLYQLLGQKRCCAKDNYVALWFVCV
jgi:hypothetical protein